MTYIQFWPRTNFLHGFQASGRAVCSSVEAKDKAAEVRIAGFDCSVDSVGGLSPTRHEILFATTSEYPELQAGFHEDFRHQYPESFIEMIYVLVAPWIWIGDRDFYGTEKTLDFLAKTVPP